MVSEPITGMKYKIINFNTPVELYNGIYVKRDDLFQPFGPHGVNGGKARQGIELIRRNLKTIKNSHHGTIVTTTSVHSTTGAIMAQVAKHYKLKCVICIGGSSGKTVNNHPMMRLAKEFGAKIINVCGTGMSGPVLKRMGDYIRENGFFDATFNNNADSCPEAILDMTMEQVANLPDDLDNLIVPVGGGMQMASIIRGLTAYKKTVKRVIGCHVGPDRREKIDYFINPLEYPILDYEMHPLNTTYGKPATEYLTNAKKIQLDEIYEAKAWKWMKDNIDTENEKTLFWVVGRRLFEKEIYEHHGV